MKRLFRASLILGLVSLRGIVPALADQVPASGHFDPRMRYVDYNPGQVVHLSAVVGSTLVIGFADTETVSAVAEADSIHLAAVPKQNYLFLKPSAVLALQPVIVLTQRQDGSLRRYVFEIATLPDNDATALQNVFYSVQFTYSIDDAAAAQAKLAADAAKTAALNTKALATAEATATHSILVNQKTNPAAGPRNYKYDAQGAKSLAPAAIWDNGYSTFIQFPGNTRIPSIFVVDPDGKEATATYSVDGDTIQISQTAREFRLRDGSTVLNIFNRAYNQVGGNPDTGTVSPTVKRVVVPVSGSN